MLVNEIISSCENANKEIGTIQLSKENNKLSLLVNAKQFEIISCTWGGVATGSELSATISEAGTATCNITIKDTVDNFGSTQTISFTMIINKNDLN